MTQFDAGKATFDIAGYISFLLWRSVYVTKQVHYQNLASPRQVDAWTQHCICRLKFRLSWHLVWELESHREWRMHAGQHEESGAHPV